MYKSVLIIFLLGLLSISATQKNSQSTKYFIQFRINVINDEKQARQIDHKMKNKSGISSSKTDHITSTFYCSLNPGADYTEVDFENWFTKMGYEISCFHKGIQGVDNVISPHELKSCVDEE